MAKEKTDEKSDLLVEIGEKLGKAHQKLTEDVLKLAEEAMADLYEEYIKEEMLKNYLVDGAVLKCNMSTKKTFKEGGTDVELKYLGTESEEQRDNRERTRLYVRKDDGKMQKGESRFATVKDCKQSKLPRQIDEEDGSSGPNIYPFRCNCAVKGVKKTEEEKIEEIGNNLDYCETNGVCAYLMDLETEWINYIDEKKIYFENRILEDESTGVDADCIRMTSVLTCKRGGLITPVESGQEKTELSVDLNIIRDYLKDGENEAEAEGAIKDLAAISGKILPSYAPADAPGDSERIKRKYNQYDDLIIGWSEYYRYKHKVEIDPVIIKSQIYRESQMGYFIQRNAQNNPILAANSERDIMQALDIRNTNLYDYTEYRPDQFDAGTYDYGPKSALWIWKLNRADAPPEEGILNRAKYNRCNGIVDTLFTINNVEGAESPYLYNYDNVTQFMSIGMGMDRMMDLLKAYGNDYGKALAEYNGSDEKEKYSNDIIERAKNGEFQEVL